MKSPRSLRPFTSMFFLAAALIALPVGAADAPAPLPLENAGLRLELGGSPAPGLSRLVHKASGQVLVAGPGFRNLFTITAGQAEGKLETVESSAAGHSEVHLTKEGASTQCVIQYSRFPAPWLRSVAVTVICPEKEPQTLWSLQISFEPGYRLRTVRFPQFQTVASIGESEDDFLLLPALAGTLVASPGTSWRAGQSATLSYPGNLSSQFLSFQDRTAGLLLAGRDAGGHPMSLTVLRQPDGFRFWHEFTVVPGEAPATPGIWGSPYPVSLAAAQGSWCHTADQYKQWAVQQPWCAKKLTDRTDIPAWWKEGPDVHVCEVRTYDGKRTCTGSYYPKLADHLRTFREKIDGPIVPMLAGWENHRRWTAGAYFPLFDAPQAIPVLRQIRQDGFRPFFFLSGLFYTFRNEGRDGGEIPDAEKHRSAYVLADSGEPKTYTLNESNAAGDWKRQSYQFCAAAPATTSFFLDVVRQAHEAGVEVLQMDQTVSGAGDACYSQDHGHPPGAGRYQSLAFWDLLDAMREHGKRLSSGFVLFHEEPHEQLIPHLDGFHMREYAEKRWYRGYPGAVGIPLFSYLYHEFALGYGGDSAGLSKDNNRWNVRCHAMNLVAGRTPGGAIWSSHQSMYEAHPQQVTMLRNHSRLLRSPARDFLLLGTMLHPLELKVPAAAISVAVQRGSQWVREPLPTPSILTSSWQSPDGRVGHLFVNIAETRQMLHTALDTRNLAPFPVSDARRYRSTGGDGWQPLWSGQALPQPFQLEMEPLEVVFVEIARQR